MKQIVWVLLAIAALALFFGDGSQSEETFRYKLTINVTVDGSPYSASSVIEARQRVGWCLLGNDRCLPTFIAKGVAPMITLPDGAVIFASLSGHYDSQALDVSGVAASRLPWAIYIDAWPRGNVVALLPRPTPRVEIPFEGHPKSKQRPPIFWVPQQVLGPAVGSLISNSNAYAVSGRSIDLVNFAIEPTTGQVIEELTDGPPWLEAYRGGPKKPQSFWDQHIQMIREGRSPIDQQTAIFGFQSKPGRSSP